MSLTLTPWIEQRFLDSDGNPLNGGRVYTYVAGGTSVAQATYTTMGGTVQNANPIILNSAGRPTSGGIFLAATSYTIEVKTSADVLLYTVTVPSTGLTAGLIGTTSYPIEGDPNCPITATSLPSGTTFSTCHAGTAWLSIDSANLTGTYILTGMLQGISGVTVTASLVNLTDGTPDTPLVSITSTSTTGEFQSSGAITFATAGASKKYAVKCKTSSGTGYAWALGLSRSA